jgi:RNA polymerase sigma factor (TIGR02999 family)
MRDVTRILADIKTDKSRASEELLPIVYEELRKLAKSRMLNERLDHTLQGTALVHEAYIRLVGDDSQCEWESRGHFFAAASEAMRRILIESARGKSAQKRGGGRQRITLDESDLISLGSCDPELLIDIDDCLTRLAISDADAAELVKLRLFSGLSVAQAGEVMGMSRSNAYRTWDYIRAWFSIHFPADRGI